jgi:aminoglycoside phosphotransferase (APT) family kinase protein
LRDETSAELCPPSLGLPLDVTALGAYIAQHGMTLDADPPPRQFAGGLANINYLIYLGGVPRVLRRPPPGDLPPGSFDMAREHRILSRLPDALDFVPRSLHLCTDTSILGVPFQILEFRPGLVIRGTLPPELTGRPAVGARLSQVLLETIAAIHEVDPAAVGLGDFGRPEGFLQRAVSGWRKRGAIVKEEGTEALHADLGAWLEAHLVPDEKPALLHNDFKLDNMILAPRDLAPVGVVDWDQGTRGDPLFDFATLLSYWAEPDDPPAMHDMAQMPTAEPGFLTRHEATQTYAALSGRDMSDFLFHRVLGMYKLGVIFLQLGHRHRTGATADARYAGLSGIGTGLLEFTQDIAYGRTF